MFHVYVASGHGFYTDDYPLEGVAPMSTQEIRVADNPQRGAQEAREMLADGRTRIAYLPKHQITAVVEA